MVHVPFVNALLCCIRIVFSQFCYVVHSTHVPHSDTKTWKRCHSFTYTYSYERDVRYAEHLHEGFLYEVQYQYEDTLDLHFVLQLRREYPSATTYSPEEEDLVLEPLGDGVRGSDHNNVLVLLEYDMSLCCALVLILFRAHVSQITCKMFCEQGFRMFLVHRLLKQEKEPVFAIGACDAPGKRPCYFRRSVISQTFENGCDPVCPTCNLRFTLPGPQPTGLMIVHINTTDPCAGYEQHDTIVISYEFMSGYQGARMDSPGTPYSGTLRAAFLPDTPEGRRALRLLVKAFKQGFLFRVGTSITTRRADTVVWGGIHQKTSLTGGVVDHGWPDDTYFDRLTSECMAHGITDDELVDSYGQP